MSETPLTSVQQAREHVAYSYEYSTEPEPRTLEQPHSSEHAERLVLEEEETRGAIWDAAEREQQVAEELERAQAVSYEASLRHAAESMPDDAVREYIAQLSVNQAAIRSHFTLAA